MTAQQTNEIITGWVGGWVGGRVGVLALSSTITLQQAWRRVICSAADISSVCAWEFKFACSACASHCQ